MAVQRTLEGLAARTDTGRALDHIPDLGTGTGLLALFACRGGARKVYAVEQGYIIREIAY